MVTTILANQRGTSLSETLRVYRFNLFLKTLKPCRNCTILDVGGTSAIWTGTGFESNVTLLNLTKPKSEDLARGFNAVQGNALNMDMFSDGQFDIVFSNSVIEHVGSWENQKQFAAEVKRVGKHYWIQTPNRYFPVEPHFLFPFFQFFSQKLQRRIALAWRYSHFKKYGLPGDRILDELSCIRLLSIRELEDLFGECYLYREDLFGMTKSLVMYK